MVKMEGRWRYQSFRPEPGSLSADRVAPEFVPWSPPGVMTVDPGDASGTLEFTLPPPSPPLRLALTIRVVEGTPDQLFISAVTKGPGGTGFTNELHGWFVPPSLGQDKVEPERLTVRGAIVQTSEDIIPVGRPNRQPIHTTGFFVLERLKEDDQ